MKVASNRIMDVYRHYIERLKQEYPEEEAKIMICTLLKEYADVNKTEIFTEPGKTINESELLKIHFGVKALLKSMPLQYVIGYTEFYGCKIRLDPHVLIPRPETEQLVDIILKENQGNPAILDIGTGSGAIAIALKKHLPLSEVYALEFSGTAIGKASENAGLNNVPLKFIHHDILDPAVEHEIPGALDIIVSNPPYVMEKEKKFMKDNVLAHEPAAALFVPDLQPLVFYERIAMLGQKFLTEGGRVYVEINESLGAETYEIFSRLKYRTELKRDLQEKDRFIKAVKI